VKPKSLLLFTQKLKEYGLRSDVIFPSYGQAEHVAGICDFRVDASTSETMQLSADDTPVPGLVPNGRVSIVSEDDMDTIDIRIVEPDSCVELGTNAIGEIWVHSPSKSTRGYWNNPAQTEVTLGARIKHGNGQISLKSYLRTGDLGFLDKDRRLYICGRLKDIIIIRGANVYPQDIEDEVQALSGHIRPGCIAVFRTTGCSSPATSGDILEGVDVVAEVRRVDLPTREYDEISDKIFRSIAVNHPGVKVFKVCFIPPKCVPKTSSGKIQRGEARALLLASSLKVVYQKQRTVEGDEGSQSEATAGYRAELRALSTPTSLSDVYNILGLLLVAAGGKIDSILLADIRCGDRCATFSLSSLGLDSLTVVTLSRLLADQVQVDLSPTQIYECVTVQELVIKIAQGLHSPEVDMAQTTMDHDVTIITRSPTLTGEGLDQNKIYVSRSCIVGFGLFQIAGVFITLWILFSLWTPCYWLLENFFDQSRYTVLAQIFRYSLALDAGERSTAFRAREAHGDPFCIPYRNGPSGNPYFANVYVGVSVGLAVTVHVFAVLVAISAVLLKWALVQRVTVGSYSLWGLQHARVWLASLFVGTAGHMLTFFFPDSILLILWYRLLGVRVAWTADVEGHSTLALGVWDVISVGDRSSVSSSALLEAFAVSRGSVRIAAIRVGAGCDIGDAAVVQGGCDVPDGCGSPPMTVYRDDNPNEKGLMSMSIQSSGNLVWWSLTKAISWFMVNSCAIVVCLLPVVGVSLQFQDTDLGPISRLLFLFLLTAVFIVSWMVLVIFFKRALSYHPLKKPGSTAVLDLSAQLRRVLFSRLHAVVASYVMRYFAITGLNTIWYTLLGANISPSAIFSAAVHFDDPEVVTVGNNTLLGGGARIKTALSRTTGVELGAVTLGDHVFVSQKTILSAGSHLHDYSRVLPLTHVPPKSTLPQWAVTTGCDSNRYTHVPEIVSYSPHQSNWYSFPSKLFQQIAGFLWMIGIHICAAISIAITLYYFEVSKIVGSLHWPIAVMVGILVSISGLLCTKWVFLWRAAPRTDLAHWNSGRIWAWSVVFCTYNVFTTYFSDLMLGGPLMNLFLSLMGANISPSAFVGSSFIYDWDLVTIDSNAVIKCCASLTPHIIENSTEIAYLPVRVGHCCEVGINSLVLGGCTLSNGASLAHSSRASAIMVYNKPLLYSGSPAISTIQNPHGHSTSLPEANCFRMI